MTTSYWFKWCRCMWRMKPFHMANTSIYASSLHQSVSSIRWMLEYEQKVTKSFQWSAISLKQMFFWFSIKMDASFTLVYVRLIHHLLHSVGVKLAVFLELQHCRCCMRNINLVLFCTSNIVIARRFIVNGFDLGKL